MASSPPCNACGRRALRHRKRTDDFVCRTCGAVLPAADVRANDLAGAQLRRLTRRRRPGADLTGRREVALALADMRAACDQLDSSVARISIQHHPMGCLPFVLALFTGAIVAGVLARSLRWYVTAPLSFGGAALSLLALMYFRFASWKRHHPLLAQLAMMKHFKRGDDDGTDDKFLDLGAAIVKHYLPEKDSEALLARLDDARERMVTLLGLDDEESLAPRSR